MNWDLNLIYLSFPGGSPGGSAGKESTCNARDLGLVPGLERSPGEGDSYPLQYVGLENSMDCTVHGITKNQTQLSNFHFHYLTLEYKCFHKVSQRDKCQEHFSMMLGGGSGS